MSPDTGVYAITVRCDSINESLDGIGLCLKDADLGNNWADGIKHFMLGHNRCLVGESDCDFDDTLFEFEPENPFYLKCKWIGDPMPELKTGAELEMIYDSNKGEMRFKINGEDSGSCVQNLDYVGDFYWCVGVYDWWFGTHAVSIVDYNIGDFLGPPRGMYP